MRQNGSVDCYRLAAIALSAAIRDEADLLELIPADPAPKPRGGAAISAELLHEPA